MNLYAERDIENLKTYFDHVLAMTGESLHSKSAIAAELAYRDSLIEKAEVTDEMVKAVVESLIKSDVIDDNIQENHKNELNQAVRSALQGALKAS